MIIEKREEIMKLFDKYNNFLTQTQKQAMYLRYVEDLTLAEIAEILAVTRQAINDALKKGEKKLHNIDQKIS